ncbi:MAG: hypothetical protein ACP5FQ_00475 [Thermoplasmata archaeon]
MIIYLCKNAEVEGTNSRTERDLKPTVIYGKLSGISRKIVANKYSKYFSSLHEEFKGAKI